MLLQSISKKTLEELKRSFMEEYDVNHDGKIEIKEVRLQNISRVTIYICDNRIQTILPYLNVDMFL